MPAAFRRLAILHLPMLAQAVAQGRGDGVVAELRAFIQGYAGDGDDGHSENSLHNVAVPCAEAAETEDQPPAATCVGEENQWI